MKMKGNLISLIGVIFILLTGVAVTGCATTTARTPLMQAVKQSDSNTIRALLDKGTDINEQSDYALGPGGKGWTALYLAAVKGDIKIISLLLDYGADPGIATKFGWTPLKWAEQKGNNFVTGMLKEAMEKRYMVDKKPAHITTEKPIAKSDVDDLPPLQAKPNKNAYAIIIGVEKYRQKLPKADYAENDARIMAEYLAKVMGYPEENVVTLLNDRALKSDFEKYIGKWLPNNVEKDSSVFVYYSGHGAPNPKTGDAYLVPYDGDPSFIEETGYPLKRLYAKLDRLQAKEIIVVLDSCFSGAGGRSVLAKGARPLVMNMDKQVIHSDRIAILSASSGSQISSTHEKEGHGLFTYFLLKGIKEGNSEIGTLYNYLKPQVEKIARKTYNNEQTPGLIAPKGLLNLRLYER
jgi:hypothetical protein